MRPLALHFEETVIYLILLIGLIALHRGCADEDSSSSWIGFHLKELNDFFHGSLTAIVYIISYLALMLASEKDISLLMPGCLQLLLQLPQPSRYPWSLCCQRLFHRNAVQGLPFAAVYTKA